MTVIEKNITLPVEKKLHIELNLPEDITSEEIKLVINITLKPKPNFEEIYKKHHSILKDSATFQGDSVELVRKLRDGNAW
ncbi:MAG: hypothetical protein LBR79_03820 [Oscillospiraceae bacterium]|jgi:hypothetical protein|nr:hypothetical protein [Oscillospiraceae bacterium]